MFRVVHPTCVMLSAIGQATLPQVEPSGKLCPGQTYLARVKLCSIHRCTFVSGRCCTCRTDVVLGFREALQFPAASSSNCSPRPRIILSLSNRPHDVGGLSVNLRICFLSPTVEPVADTTHEPPMQDAKLGRQALERRLQNTF